MCVSMGLMIRSGSSCCQAENLLHAEQPLDNYCSHGMCNGLTDLAKRVQPIPVVDATLAPSYCFEGAGGRAPQHFWLLAAGTG